MKLVDDLILETALSRGEIIRFCMSGCHQYKFFPIPKKNGGWRHISQPARRIKLIQRAFSKIVLSKLPIHSSAMAYRKNIGILDNAVRHAGHSPIMKLDFQDFFPSIKAADWQSYCKEYNVLATDQEIMLSSRLLFHYPKQGGGLCLAIGAPSSPILSNVLMYNFDQIVTNLLVKEKVIYTRYADDLTFSAPRTGFLNSVMPVVSYALRQISYPKLTINEAKTRKITTKYRRTVTGITLSNDGTVGIGHEQKRDIRLFLYNALEKHIQYDSGDLEKMAGHLAYIRSIDLAYFEKIQKKYGRDLIKTIQRGADSVTDGPTLKIQFGWFK